MKTLMEVQRMHDLLLPVITGEVDADLSKENRPLFHASLDVLCWILEHDHNTSFPANMARLEAHLESKGHVLNQPDIP